jgi:uncharacterized RDD family membrane protein YckC
VAEKKIVVGFWLRFVSDLLDASLLAVFGFLLSIPFGELFYQMGDSGLWIGLVIAFLYAGILQSGIGQGQSIAKKLLNIQVVRLDGSYLSLSQSFLRYLVVAFVFYNQWIGMGIISAFPALNNSVFQFVYGLIIFALLLGISLLVAIHPLKRGLHDLLVGSIVVRKQMYDAENIAALKSPAKENRAFVICALVIVLLVCGQFFLFQKTASLRSDIEELIPQKQAIEENTQLTKVFPNLLWRVSQEADGSRKKTTGFGILGHLPKAKFEDEKIREAEAQKAVDIVVKFYSKISACDYIHVKIATGYNIGIWSFTQAQNYLFGLDGKIIKK